MSVCLCDADAVARRHESKSACCANVWKTGKGALIFMRSDDLTSAESEHGLPENAVIYKTMKGGGKMADAQQINDFLVDAFGRINKIEERAMTTGLGSAISITEIHIIEKIGLSEPARMSEIAHMLGVTLATMTVACDKLEGKGLVRRARSRSDRRVVQVTLTPRGRAVYEYHRAFHERMISSILDTLSPEQSTVLAQSLEKLQDFFLREEAAAEGENNG